MLFILITLPPPPLCFLLLLAVNLSCLCMLYLHVSYILLKLLEGTLPHCFTEHYISSVTASLHVLHAAYMEGQHATHEYGPFTSP